MDALRPPVCRDRGKKRKGRRPLPRQPRKYWDTIIKNREQFRHFRLEDWPETAGARPRQLDSVSLRRVSGTPGVTLKPHMAAAQEYIHLKALTGDRRTQDAAADGAFPAPDAKREREVQVLPFGRVRKFPETKDKHIRGNDFTAAKYVPVTGSSRSLSGSPPRTWPTRGALRSPSW